jgi:hypothetical protein
MLKNKNSCESCVHYCEKESLNDKNVIEKIKFCGPWNKVLKSMNACDIYRNKKEARIRDIKVEIKRLEDDMIAYKFMCLFFIGIILVIESKKRLKKLKEELKELEDDKQII